MYSLRYLFLAIGIVSVLGAAVSGHIRTTAEKDSKKAKTSLLLTVILALISAAGFLLFHCAVKDTAVQREDAPVVSAEESQPAETAAPAPEAQPEETAAPAEVSEHSESGFDLDALASFAVTSENLHDGIWDSVITNTENGQNHSPQLSWEAVPDAGCYAVFMADSTANQWLHWKSGGITETSLPEGWAPETEYIGPYPPGGTHTYDIYVFAMKKPLSRLKGAFNSSNPVFLQKTLPSLDITDDGESGNVIACGRISGTYTCGD
ncbi:MAG: hypothetical protein K5705_01195 [Oscillospiraceae bacterium]|nr:hypothetical protein [Oscillospiraceae bacterium]